MFPEDIEAMAHRLVARACETQSWMTTAESCTGGLVAAAITSVAGASAVFDRSFVTYSNSAKTEMIGVHEDLLLAHGAVSEAVARAMAIGARDRSGVDIAVGVTGIAGPGGGSEDKPVGLVHFGLALADGTTLHREMRFGDLGRDRVRLGAVKVALEMLELGLG